jgi:hypothetical protein
VTTAMPGARIGRILLIIVAIVVVLGLIVSGLGTPAAY